MCVGMYTRICKCVTELYLQCSCNSLPQWDKPLALCRPGEAGNNLNTLPHSYIEVDTIDYKQAK